MSLSLDRLEKHYGFWVRYLSLRDVKVSPATLLLFIISAYLFAVSVRYTWTYQFAGQSDLFWRGFLLLITPDGYHWAQLTSELLTSGYYWVEESFLPTLTASIVQLSSLPLEGVMQYLPVFLGSLIVIPVVLIWHALRQPLLGFFAALYSGIAWSYFNRTVPGYFDTDMLNVVFPMFIAWGFVDSFVSKHQKLTLVVPLMLIGYGLWYPSSASLNNAMLLSALLYTAVFDRKSILNYKLIGLCALAIMTSIPLAWKLGGILLLWYLYFRLSSPLTARVVIWITSLLIVLWLAVDFSKPIVSMLDFYGFRHEVRFDDADSVDISSSVTALDMTAEAQPIPLREIGLRVSGDLFLFVAGGIGYALLLVKFPVMFVTVPMIVLGLSAYATGLRFTIYAVPLFAIGVAFLLGLAGECLWRLTAPTVRQHLYACLFISCLFLVLYPNLNHALTYRVETFLEKTEVEALDKLRTISNDDDYVFTWWDFGYPVSFYAGRNTLVDGGRNQVNQLFPVGYVLTAEDQGKAAKLARLAVDDADKYNNLSTRRILQTQGLHDLAGLLSQLQNLSLPSSKNQPQIYVYIPDRMIETFGLVVLIVDSHVEDYDLPLFWYYETVKKTSESDLLSQLDDLMFDARKGTLTSRDETILIGRYLTVVRGQDKNEVESRSYEQDSRYTVIYLDNEETLFVVDERVFNSLVMRLAIREEYDSTLFEPVVRTPKARIYKILY